jgi:ATP phosphoribosyltransferase regulatory subunit
VAQGRPGRYSTRAAPSACATAAARRSSCRSASTPRRGARSRPDAAVAAAAWQAAAAGGRDDLSLVVGDIGLFDDLAAALEIPAVLTARLRRSLSSPAALKEAFERSLAPEFRRTGPVAALLAGRPEAEGAAMLEDLWGMMGVQSVGGRSASEVARRLTERAAQAETPAFTPANAELVRRYLAINDAPDPRWTPSPAWRARPASRSIPRSKAGRTGSRRCKAKGVPLDRVRLTPAFGRAFSYYDGFLFEVPKRSARGRPAGRRRRAL